MRWLWGSLVVLAHLGLPTEANAQACLPPPPPANSERIIGWLDCFLDELGDVWTSDIAEGILLAHPQAEAITGLTLEFVSDCDFSPRLVVDQAGQAKVAFNTRLLIPQMMVSQAILWYIIAPDNVTSPREHLAYLNDVLLPAVREDSRTCSRQSATGRFNAVNIPSVFWDQPEAHPTFVALDSPSTRAIGDYLGALPAFFALIHEAGHAALHLEHEAATGREREREADGFAASVFGRSDVPVTLGLAFLLIAYDLDRAGTNDDVACRIAALAQRAGHDGHVIVPTFGIRVAARVEALRQEYIRYFSALCPDR